MLNFIIETESDGIILDQPISAGVVILLALNIAAIYITFYLLRSFGIYKLAKNQGIDKAFFAFIPCLWIYTACKLVGNSRVFGTSVDKAAVWICVIFSCAAIIPLIGEFFSYFPYVAYYLEGGTIDIISKTGGLYIGTGDDFINLFDTRVINVISVVLSYLNVILRLANIFVTVTVYIALFRKFWPEHYILASVLSFFGLFPIFAFAIRNKKAVDFSEYFRQRYYGAGYTPYGGAPYANPYANREEDKNEPFGEFDNRPEEPFGEFSDGKDEKDDKNGSDDFFQ